ncbi:hypothetical protein FOZ62_026096 [Perkinsus olseni]|uniref:Uncharacterized protein n=1 Tax=Perkinsus olseni TaxID=32597 RepID=A0A7J6SUX1_PEROL|nr:hypothetical protein FOZ62_026096 [Perkinsus olseni]
MTVRLQKPEKRRRYDPLEALVREVDRTLVELGNPSPSERTGQGGGKLERSTGVAALDAALVTAGVTRVSGKGSVEALARLATDALQERRSCAARPCIMIGRMARTLPIIRSLQERGVSSEDLDRLSLYEVRGVHELFGFLHMATQEPWLSEHSGSLIIFESLASILSPLEFSVCKSTRRLVDVVYRHIAIMEARIPTATVIIREMQPPQRAKLSLTGPTKEVRSSVPLFSLIPGMFRQFCDAH